MKFQTFSIVVGGPDCNGDCPFCVFEMTPSLKLPVLKAENIDKRNLEIACEMARMSRVTTVLFTGKGEPTLYPELITAYLKPIKEIGYRSRSANCKQTALSFIKEKSSPWAGQIPVEPGPWRNRLRFMGTEFLPYQLPHFKYQSRRDPTTYLLGQEYLLRLGKPGDKIILKADFAFFCLTAAPIPD